MDLLDYATCLLGGALIGLAATLHLRTHGRTTGVSGILAATLSPSDPTWRIRAAFVLGLVVTGALATTIAPAAFGRPVATSTPVLLAAGLLVGVGTRMSNGCTSGHGVCGLSRRSPRSLVAVASFMLVGMVTVTLVRHLLGGAT